MDVSNEYNFNAPQYREFDYSGELDDSKYGDDYFDINNEAINYQEEIIETEEIQLTQDYVGSNNHEQNEMYDEHYVEETEDFMYVEEDKENQNTPIRRSMSVGSLNLLKVEPNEHEIENLYILQDDLCEAVRTIELSGKKKKTANIPSKILSAKPIFSNEKNTARPIIRKPSSLHNSKESLNKSTNLGLKRKMSADDLGPKKYMSTAEYCNKFQFRTPDRFHSKPKNTVLQHIAPKLMTHTIPQSPKLSTKTRSRPVYYKSHDEQEKEEMEEMKKNPIKAHPINYKILQNSGPVIKIEKKQPTIPEPFNITDHKKKEPVHQPIIKQSIVPKTGVNLKLKSKISTNEKIPRIMENGSDNKPTIKKVEAHHSGVQMRKQENTTTKPELFSSQFEKRYNQYLEELQKKKEERLKQLMEEEKKKREFHAKPIPKAIGGGYPVQSRLNSSRSSRSNDSINHEEHKFKARPATVVHKKPFVPKRPDHHLSVCEFTLSTELRAKEREEYDKLLKEREEEIEMMKKLYKEEQEKEEALRIAQERKERVHKANPIRTYKPLEIVHSSQKVTSPHSPAFTKRRNETR